MTVRVRFADLRSVTRSVSLPQPVAATAILAEIAEDLVRSALRDHPEEREISLLAISVIQGFGFGTESTELLSRYTGGVSGIVTLLTIFILAPLIIARGYLFIPREEVLDQIHFESLKPAPAYDFSEEGKPDDDDKWEFDESFQARPAR